MDGRLKWLHTEQFPAPEFPAATIPTSEPAGCLAPAEAVSRTSKPRYGFVQQTLPKGLKYYWMRFRNKEIKVCLRLEVMMINIISHNLLFSSSVCMNISKKFTNLSPSSKKLFPSLFWVSLIVTQSFQPRVKLVSNFLFVCLGTQFVKLKTSVTQGGRVYHSRHISKTLSRSAS